VLPYPKALFKKTGPTSAQKLFVKILPVLLANGFQFPPKFFRCHGISHFKASQRINLLL